MLQHKVIVFIMTYFYYHIIYFVHDSWCSPILQSPLILANNLEMNILMFMVYVPLSSKAHMEMGSCDRDSLQEWKGLGSNLRHMSRIVRKRDYCLCENKDADQLRGNREADQRLCFRYTDSTIPLLLISKVSSV